MTPLGSMLVEGNRMPSGTPRPRRVASLVLHDLVGDCSQVVCYVDEVFEPVVDPDGVFRVLQLDRDVFYPVVVREGADFHFAIGRYLDQVHGAVVASFFRPASPSDLTAYASRGQHNHAA